MADKILHAKIKGKYAHISRLTDQNFRGLYILDDHVQKYRLILFVNYSIISKKQKRKDR